ncbi:MAG: hypothetical protein ACYCSN_20575 [Acidobacteriaceae bacterium]
MMENSEKNPHEDGEQGEESTPKPRRLKIPEDLQALAIILLVLLAFLAVLHANRAHADDGGIAPPLRLNCTWSATTIKMYGGQSSPAKICREPDGTTQALESKHVFGDPDLQSIRKLFGVRESQCTSDQSDTSMMCTAHQALVSYQQTGMPGLWHVWAVRIDARKASGMPH